MTPYQQFQLNKYGNIATNNISIKLNESNSEANSHEEELETGTIDREAFENWMDDQAELQLMEKDCLTD